MANGNSESVLGALLVMCVSAMFTLWNKLQGSRIKSLEVLVDKHVTLMDHHVKTEEELFRNLIEKVALLTGKSSTWDGNNRRSQ